MIKLDILIIFIQYHCKRLNVKQTYCGTIKLREVRNTFPSSSLGVEQKLHEGRIFVYSVQCLERGKRSVRTMDTR